MSGNKTIMILTFALAVFLFSLPAYAKKSKIKGDPELIWLSPLGSGDIENNDYNRCRFIKTIKPGIGHALETSQNTHDILSTYAANLYAQSVKLAGYIEAEKDNNDKDPDMSDEKALLDNEVIKRLGDISRRMNIINSFEAGTMMLETLAIINKLPEISYEEFRVIKGGQLVYSNDCEDL